MRKIRLGSVTLLVGMLSACSSSSPSSPSLPSPVDAAAGSWDAGPNADMAVPADMAKGPDAASGPATSHYAWAQRFGDTSSEVTNGLAVDKSGNVIVVGSFSGTASFGGTRLVSAGGTDLFIAKYAPDGAPLWSQRFGGSGDDSASGVAVDASGDVLLLASAVTATPNDHDVRIKQVRGAWFKFLRFGC